MTPEQTMELVRLLTTPCEYQMEFDSDYRKAVKAAPTPEDAAKIVRVACDQKWCKARRSVAEAFGMEFPIPLLI